MLTLLLPILLLPFVSVLPRRRVLGPTLLIALLGVGVAGLLSMYSTAGAMWLLGGLALFLLFANLLPERWLGLLPLGSFLRRKSLLRGVLVSVTVLLVLTGVVECAVCALVMNGVIEIDDPVKVQMMTQKEDWRLTAILEARRLVDPVPFWRPAPEPPYNEQGFKGPVMSVPKPAGLLRVMSYGDSNTDGPADGGWAVALGRELQGLLPGRQIEAVNAGVVGYSSYQGLRKFEGEVARYQPDVVLVSYGWNDAPLAVDRADKEYQPPPEGVVAVQRALSVSRSYRYLMQVLREREAHRHPPNFIGPRVSVADYVANLRGFVQLGKERGAIVVLLTRPHRDRLDNRDNWRKTVPDYNTALRSLVELEHLPLIDAQRTAADHPELFIDECHFSAEGHQLAAQFIAQHLAPLLAH